MVFNRKPEPRVVPSPSEPTPMRVDPVAPVVDANRANDHQAGPLGGFAALPESVIGNDFTIEGSSITIRCKGSLRINGSIDASLHARKLIVGDTASINGAITAENVTVHGQVFGAINGERVVLGKNSHVEGDIVSRSLEVEPGASFEGRSRKAREASEISPQLDPVAVTGAANTRVLTPPSAA